MTLLQHGPVVVVAMLRFLLGENITQFLLSLALMILIIVFFGKHYHEKLTAVCADDNVTVNATCDDGRIANDTCPTNDPCVQGYWLPDLNVCVNASLLGGAACDSPCYITDATTTTCSATGTCVGNVTECLGYCEVDADCNASIPFNLDWLGVNDTEVDVPILWTYEYICYFNKCVAFTLDLFWHQFQTGNLVAGAYPCEDYLAANFTRTSCLVIDRQVLDPNMTAPEHYLQTENVNQFSLCTFSYACSPINQSAIPTKKRTLWNVEERLMQRILNVN